MATIDLTDVETINADEFDAKKLSKVQLSGLTTRLSRNAFERYGRHLAEEVLASKDPTHYHPLVFDLVKLLSVYQKASESKATRKRTPVKRKIQPKATRGWVSGTGFGGSASVDAATINKQLHTAKQKLLQDDLALQECLKAAQKSLHLVLEDETVKQDYRVAGLGALMQTSLKVLSAKTKKRSGKGQRKTTKGARVSVTSVLRALWRNDSLMDVGERLPLYSALFSLVETMATAPVWTGLPGCIFVDESEEAEENPNDADEEEEPTASSKRKSILDKNESFTIFAVMSKLNEQGMLFCKNMSYAGDAARTIDFLKRLDKFLKGSVNSVQRNTAYYCEEVDNVGPVRKSQRRSVLRMNASKSLTDEDRQKAYVEALKDIQLKYVALMDLASATSKVQHSFLNNAKHVTTAWGSNKMRLVRIGKEMSTMSTSLPLSWGSGIFIRADSNRPDVMCAMILGPQDTPYANGAFIFDIWLPANYPQSPPKVLLKTTGHGTVRFNPNLYNCGKVCLSLLGTWQGPGWNSKESTLLQVLVSIQSLIMVAEPYFNEPGYESTMGTPAGTDASNRYNKVIREGTMRFALLDQIKNPPYLFRDVLKLHFNLKHEEIRQQCEIWVKENARVKPRHPTLLHQFCQSTVPVKSIAHKINDALDELIKGENQKPKILQGNATNLVEIEDKPINDPIDDKPIHIVDEPVPKRQRTSEGGSSSSSSSSSSTSGPVILDLT